MLRIAELFLTKVFGHKITKKIIGEVYILSKEKEGTEIHEAKEFATLLNSTAAFSSTLGTHQTPKVAFCLSFVYSLEYVDQQECFFWLCSPFSGVFFVF